jgi:hypothetical protein
VLKYALRRIFGLIKRGAVKGGQTKLHIAQLRIFSLPSLFKKNKSRLIRLLDESFSMRFVSYQRKVGDDFFSELLVYYLLFIIVQYFGGRVILSPEG